MPQESSAKQATLHPLELRAFRLCAWIVVACSFGAFVTIAIWGKPTNVPLHYPLILVLVAALLGTFAPSLSEYALARLHKVKFGGFELELSDAAGLARLHLKIHDIPPDTQLTLAADDIHDDPKLDSPFPTIKLSGPGLYQYERLSQMLYALFDQIKDPKDLDIESRENFRKLIIHVGMAAHAMNHHTKSLEVLLWLKRFTDRPLNHEELRLLGSAYLWAADEQEGEPRLWHQNEAIPMLVAARGQHPYQGIVLYNLGWALLSLKKYNDGIRQMRKCLKLDPRYSPWAKWNIACGLKKLEKPHEALKILEEIPAGPMWKTIRDDEWFKDPEPTEFSDKFQKLCKDKIGKHKGKSH